MKVAPVSADLLIKLALVGLGIGVAVWAARKVSSTAVDAAQWVRDSTKYINPASDQNVVYQGVNAAGNVLVSDPAGPGKNADGSWTLGGWLYDVTHPDAFKF